jgi:hypothetical protein
MEIAAVIAAAPGATFTDGFGTRRRRFSGAAGEDVFDLRDQLTAVGSFEFALRERVGRLTAFRHGSFAHVRRVERAAERPGSLTIVSDPIEGTRLSEVLAAAARSHALLRRDRTISVVRQVLDAVDALHHTDRDVAHGALGPERIIITPSLEAVVADYVLGSATEQLRFSPQRYWTELGVATDAGAPRFDQRLDVLQIGLVALALLLGRPLLEEEAPAHEAVLRSSLGSLSATGSLAPFVADARGWVGRALQLDAPFASAAEARDALDELLRRHPDVSAPAARVDPPAAVAVRQPAADNVPQPLVFDRPALPETEAPTAAHMPDAADGHISDVQGARSPVFIAVPEWDATILDADVSNAGAPAPELPVEREHAAHATPVTVPAAERAATISGVKTSGRRLRVYVPVAVAMLMAAAVGGETYVRRHDDARMSATGTLVVTTLRAGAAVLVDNVPKGTTPLTVSVATGRHVLELRDGLEVRVLPVTIAAGSVASEYVELPQPRPTTGALQVRTQPAGAQVTIDGVASGRSPIALKDVVAGEHTVMVTGDHDAITQTVTVGPDAAASVSISFNAAPAAALAAGWIVLSSPIAVQVFEHDHLMGSTETDRVILQAGTHQLDIVNTPLGYHARRTVQIVPGKVALVNVDVPNGALSLNAAPWAEVWLDGAPLGATPIGNVTAAVGMHQVLFRHPTLGEQRRTIAVPVSGIARLSVDLRAR